MRRGRVILLIAVAALLGGAVLLRLPAAVAGASPEPSSDPAPDSAISLTVEPMLHARFAAGSWAAFRVLVENSGPTVAGEIRISRSRQPGSTFARQVELASGARQEHILYGQVGPFTTRFSVSLVSGASTLATVDSPIEPEDASSLGVFVVAERPETLVGVIRDAVGGANPEARIETITPEQLPPRVDAWSSVDLLVWQDVDSNRLTSEQLEATRTWILMGGNLVVLGGSAGLSALGSLPPDLLPYQPAAVVEVPLSDLTALFGTLPADAAPLPALTGSLERGVALGSSGASVIAARTIYGQGSVAMLGLDPSTGWLAATTGAGTLWRQVFASNAAPPEPLEAAEEGFIVDALGNLPSVQLPPFDVLLVLLVAYVVAIGPINYFVLRRRDRREWAWITMPATIIVFAVGAYGLGLAVKGSDVIVNELTLVHGATGTDRGLAHSYIGIYSPSRAEFDVRVHGDALLSAPSVSGNPFEGPQREGSSERPVDVLLGDPATLRGYGVGFGALRAFHAQAQTQTPLVDADLRLAGETLEGTVINGSGVPLAGVSVLYGDAAEVIGDMAPGESRPVELSLARADRSGGLLWERLFPRDVGGDSAAVRTRAARRALVQHLFGGWQNEFWAGPFPQTTRAFASNGPVVLAGESGSTLDIDVGTAAEHVGERMYVLAARAQISGSVVFSGGLMQHSTVEIDALDGFEEGELFYMSRGTATVDYQPLEFEGTFRASRLSVRLGSFPGVVESTTGMVLAPLPEEEQPDPDEPLASGPDAIVRSGLPRLQLFDRTAGTWVEFEPLDETDSYDVAQPERYVDASGAIRARFVVRGLDEYAEFALGVRLEGTIE